MNSGGFSVEVTGLSPKATEKDVYDFFAFVGNIRSVEIIRAGDSACTAYVTFETAYDQETACHFNGGTILDQSVYITTWGESRDRYDFWNGPVPSEPNTSDTQRSQFFWESEEAVTKAQEAVKAMVAKGFVLGKDAMSKARELDESHQVSAKFSELSQRLRLGDKLSTGVEAVRSVDERYHVTEMTKSALSATGKTASAAASTVVNSSYFSRGAIWVSDALNRASKVAEDMGNRNR